MGSNFVHMMMAAFARLVLGPILRFRLDDLSRWMVLIPLQPERDGWLVS